MGAGSLTIFNFLRSLLLLFFAINIDLLGVELRPRSAYETETQVRMK